MLLGPTICPDRSFMDELTGMRALVQLSQLVDLTGEEDTAAVRTIGQPITSGRGKASNEGSECSRSATPLGEPI